MRVINYTYLKEAHSLMKESGAELSNKRLRRMAYIAVHQNNYTMYRLYNEYKKIVNSEAANNQLMVLIIVISLITAVMFFIFI